MTIQDLTMEELIGVLKGKEHGLVEYLIGGEFADAVDEAIRRLEEQQKEIERLKKESAPKPRWVTSSWDRDLSRWLKAWEDDL